MGMVSRIWLLNDVSIPARMSLLSTTIFAMREEILQHVARIVIGLKDSNNIMQIQNRS